jgi:hypothetical protein
VISGSSIDANPSGLRPSPTSIRVQGRSTVQNVRTCYPNLLFFRNAIQNLS